MACRSRVWEKRDSSRPSSSRPCSRTSNLAGSQPESSTRGTFGGHWHPTVATPETRKPCFQGFRRSGRRDSNSGPLVPQTSALTRLRHAPRPRHPSGHPDFGALHFPPSGPTAEWQRHDRASLVDQPHRGPAVHRLLPRQDGLLERRLQLMSTSQTSSMGRASLVKQRGLSTRRTSTCRRLHGARLLPCDRCCKAAGRGESALSGDRFGSGSLTCWSVLHRLPVLPRFPPRPPPQPLPGHSSP